MSAYDGDRNRAWDMAFREETVPLVVSFYKETLRFWTTTPFATPRATANRMEYRDLVIPKGVTMIMNLNRGITTRVGMESTRNLSSLLDS